MVKKLKTLFSTHTLAVLVVLYLCTRLFNLTVLPMFTDESIYIYWATLIETTHSQWFISLYDGKPPLLTLMIAGLLTIFPHEWHLVAGRLPSVFAGAVSMVGIYTLANFLFRSKRIAVISSLLYIVFPFNLVYDRMALYDSLLTATLVWATYFAVKTAKTLSYKDALLWGISLGFGFLSKPPALLFLLLTPFCFAFLTYRDNKFRWKKVIPLTLVAIVVSEAINNVQRLSNSYSLMAIKNAQFQQPIEELLKNPFALTIGNMYQFSTWIIAYYTVPVAVFSVIALLYILKKNWENGIILFALWIVPMFILATVGRQVFPRYIVFVTPYVIIPLAYLLVSLIERYKKRKLLFFIFLGVVFFQVLRFDYYILTNPAKAAFPTADYNQYVSEHPSGYGLDKIFAYLDREAKKGKVTIVTEGTFGLYPYAFQLRYWSNKNVTIIPRWPLSIIDQEIHDKRKTSNVFIILKEHKFVPGHLLLRQIIRAEKPGDGNQPIILTTFL